MRNRPPNRPFPRGNRNRRPADTSDDLSLSDGSDSKPNRKGGRNRKDLPGKTFAPKGGKYGKESKVLNKAPEVKVVHFSELVMSKARAAFPDLVGPAFSPEPLAKLEYSKELDLKNKALQEFWKAHELPDKPNLIHPSPKPRKYRVTTKRKVMFENGRFRIDFLPEKREAGQPRLGAHSELEPEEHAIIYAFLIDKLNTPAYVSLGRALNFLVIRGDYHRFAVFFNVNVLSAQVARKAKLLADHLQALDLGKGAATVTAKPAYAGKAGTPMRGPGFTRTGNPKPIPSLPGASPAGAAQVAPVLPDAPKVASAYLFYDPGRSPFYLDDRAPEGPWKLKRLFGPETVRLRVRQRSYAFQPTAFCQVNASILPDFLEKAEQLLKPRPEQRLFDLYCGFGFFSLHLSPLYRETLGVDAAGAAIESAKDMAKAEDGNRAKFNSGRILGGNLARLLPPVDGGPEAFILDPPRKGVEAGVIRELAARAPVRVLHIFCDMDTLPREVNQWRKAGYMIAKVLPVDMFPGTDNLEVMVAFIPDRYGILNRIDAPARNVLEAAGKDASKNINPRKLGPKRKGPKRFPGQP